MRHEPVVIQGHRIENVHNRVKFAVADVIDELMRTEYRMACNCQICIEDIFAKTLNDVPPRYVNDFGLELTHITIPRETILNEARYAIEVVMANPNHERKLAETG